MRSGRKGRRSDEKWKMAEAWSGNPDVAFFADRPGKNGGSGSGDSVSEPVCEVFTGWAGVDNVRVPPGAEHRRPAFLLVWQRGDCPDRKNFCTEGAGNGRTLLPVSSHGRDTGGKLEGSPRLCAVHPQAHRIQKLPRTEVWKKELRTLLLFGLAGNVRRLRTVDLGQACLRKQGGGHICELHRCGSGYVLSVSQLQPSGTGGDRRRTYLQKYLIQQIRGQL